MRAHSDSKGPLKLQALYSVPMLARAAGVTQQMLKRLLRANGVVMLCTGRSLFVPLTEIQRHIPPLWHSIVSAERVRADAKVAAESASPSVDSD